MSNHSVQQFDAGGPNSTAGGSQLETLAAPSNNAGTLKRALENEGQASAPGVKRKKQVNRNHQLKLARESAARNRAAKESGQLQEATVKELTLPFRAIRRIMKLDKSIGTVQMEAAIVATKAAELFVQKLAKESHKHAEDRGRSGIKYEDLAETRATNDNLAFLDTLLP